MGMKKEAVQKGRTPTAASTPTAQKTGGSVNSNFNKVSSEILNYSKEIEAKKANATATTTTVTSNFFLPKSASSHSQFGTFNHNQQNDLNLNSGFFCNFGSALSNQNEGKAQK